MNAYMDTSEFLKLQETANGYILFINYEPQNIIVEDKKIMNDLTENQLAFVNDYV